MTAPTRPAALYRFFSSDGALLYAGCSYNPFQRWALHFTTRPDISEVARVEIQWFDRHRDAALAEAVAIRDERPLWNKRASLAPFSEPSVIGQGPMLLKAWLEDYRPLAGAMMIRAGLRDDARHALVAGRRPPCPQTAQRIERLTKGQVPASAWATREGWAGKPIRGHSDERCAAHEAELRRHPWWEESFAALMDEAA